MTTIFCKDGSIKRCSEGTYGCFGSYESDVGVCAPQRTTCSNPIPDNVAILNNINSIGKCQQDGDNLVCTFENYCSS